MLNYNKQLEKKNILEKKKFIIRKIEVLANSLKSELGIFDVFEIPKKEIIFFFKKKLLQSFSFPNNSFDKKLNILFVPKYIFFFIIFFFKLLFFNKKKIIKNSFLLLIDNIETEQELYFYKNIIKNLGKKNVAIRNLNNINIGINNFFMPRYKYYNLSYNEFFFLIRFLLVAIKISIKHKINFLYLGFKFIDQSYYFKNFFSQINFKFLLMHQYYYSCNIKNFYFKKYGGLKSCLIQKNINSQNENGLLHSADIFFTLGKNSLINNINSYSEVKKNVPVGSFLMKSVNKKILINNNKNIDVLYLGGNGLYKNSYYDSYSSYKDDYITCLNWISKISLEYPNLKVCYKDHKNNYDFSEKKILSKSNIVFLDQTLDSYKLANKAKFICSWASTMILEYRALNFFSFFLDPNGQNHQFLDGIKDREEISICHYEKFKKLILKSQKKIFYKKSDIKFCNYNHDTSKLISNYFIK